MDADSSLLMMIGRESWIAQSGEGKAPGRPSCSAYKAAGKLEWDFLKGCVVIGQGRMASN